MHSPVRYVFTVLTKQFNKPSSKIQSSADGSGGSAYSLEITRVGVSKGACVFHFTDSGPLIEHLRSLVRAAAQDPQLRALETELGLPALSLSSYMSIPDIVHSTFVRYDDIRFKTQAEQDAFRGELEALAASWRPVTVALGSFHLVHEVHPYMQMQKRRSVNVNVNVNMNVAGGGVDGAQSQSANDQAQAQAQAQFPGVVASPIIATYSVSEFLEGASTVASTAASTAASASATPGHSAENPNEITLTPLSPLYHRYCLGDEGTGEGRPAHWDHSALSELTALSALGAFWDVDGDGGGPIDENPTS